MTDAPLLQVKLGPVLCQGYLLIASQFDLWCDFICVKNCLSRDVFSEDLYLTIVLKYLLTYFKKITFIQKINFPNRSF